MCAEERRGDGISGRPSMSPLTARTSDVVEINKKNVRKKCLTSSLQPGNANRNQLTPRKKMVSKASLNDASLLWTPPHFIHIFNHAHCHHQSDFCV